MNDLGIILEHSVLTENGKIIDFIPNHAVGKTKADDIIDLTGNIMLPGFIDCHTHTMFAGSRSDEFRMKLQGACYEDIARAGGGIVKTVEAVRLATVDDLALKALNKVKAFIEQGVTTIEIKSGYGLDFKNEIKLLEAVNKLNNRTKAQIIPTFLGAHTYPKECGSDHSIYIEEITNKMLPYIAEHNLAEFCDAFCESTAFSAEETSIVFDAAKRLGLKIKLHSEQFNNIGGIETGIKYNAVSVDHLEMLKPDDYHHFFKTETAAVLLPGAAFFLNYGFAPARNLIDGGAIVALSSDFNPGSSHIQNISMLMGIAALKMKMTIEEVISAFTINAAKALSISEKTGSIEIGKLADFAILNTEDYCDLIYNMGSNLNTMTVKAGEIIFQNTRVTK